MERSNPESLAARLQQSSAGVPIRERYGLVLCLIIGAYLLTGLDPRPWIRLLTSVLWAVLLLVTLWAPAVPRRIRAIGVVAIGLILVMSMSLSLLSDDAAAAGRLLLLAIAQAAAIAAIISQIIRHEWVNLQTVMGGVAAYALIAFVMAAIYNGADLLTDSAFLNGVVDGGDYTYFSFVTLTTVGYGDITAATEFAKRLVVVEAFFGQVFIIVFVARLVSLWGKPIGTD